MIGGLQSCAECGAPVIVARHVTMKTRMALDANPCDSGIALMVGPERFTVLVPGSPRDDEHRPPGTVYVFHMTTCPKGP